MAGSVNLNRSRIVGNITTLFSGSVLAQAMTALALLFTARQLNANVYGQYAASIAIVSLSSICFSLGLDIWLLREGGRSKQQLPFLTGSVLGIKSSLGLIWIIIFSLIAPLLNQDTYPIRLIHWSLLLILLDNLFATTLTGFKSSFMNKPPVILEASADFIWFALTLLLILIGSLQPETYLQIRVVVVFAVLVVALLYFHRKIGIHFNRGVAIQALKSMFPFASSEFLGMVTMRADVVIIGLTLGEYATGIYSPAVGLINMALIVPIAVYTVMMPVLGNLYTNHPQQAKQTSKRTILLLFVIGIVLMLLFLFGAPLFGLILGDTYLPTVEIIRILSMVLLFKCVSFAMAAIMIATDKQVKRPVVQLVAACTNILLNLAIVNILGVSGVAGVYVITEIILLAGYSWVVWYKR
jgi:O-antigen/teichoic acid export membrane protein